MCCKAGKNPKPCRLRNQSFVTRGSYAYPKPPKQVSATAGAVARLQEKEKSVGWCLSESSPCTYLPLGSDMSQGLKNWENVKGMLLINWKPSYSKPRKASLSHGALYHRSIHYAESSPTKCLLFPPLFQVPRELFSHICHETFLIWRLSEVSRVLILNW